MRMLDKIQHKFLKAFVSGHLAGLKAGLTVSPDLAGRTRVFVLDVDQPLLKVLAVMLDPFAKHEIFTGVK